jgi:hypothetical protein
MLSPYPAFMPRSYAASDIVDLPRLDAASALTLASSLEAAAVAQVAAGATLPDAVADARSDMADDYSALKAVFGDVPSESEIREADQDEDAAAGAMYEVLSGWARLAGRIPEGDTAKALVDRLFSDGVAFINFKARKEWAVVETKLGAIEHEGLDTKLATLGASPILAYLQKVHARYGEVVGATQPKVVESPQVREKLDALLDSMRQYVTSVTGSVRKKVPETKKLADALLQPLADWKSAPPKPKAKAPAAPAQPPAAPAQPPAAGGTGGSNG